MPLSARHLSRSRRALGEARDRARLPTTPDSGRHARRPKGLTSHSRSGDDSHRCSPCHRVQPWRYHLPLRTRGTRHTKRSSLRQTRIVGTSHAPQCVIRRPPCAGPEGPEAYRDAPATTAGLAPLCLGHLDVVKQADITQRRARAQLCARHTRPSRTFRRQRAYAST